MHSSTKTADQPALVDSSSALDGPPELVVSTFFDVNDQSSALSGGSDLHYAQLTCGQFSGSCRELKMRHFQVVRETNNIPVNMYGTLWSHGFVVSIPLRMLGNGSINGLTWGPGSSVILRGDRDHEAIMPPADVLYLAVDARVLEDYISVVEGVSMAGLTQGPIVLPKSPAIIGLTAHLLDLLELLLRLCHYYVSRAGTAQHLAGDTGPRNADRARAPGKPRPVEDFCRTTSDCSAGA